MQTIYQNFVSVAEVLQSKPLFKRRDAPDLSYTDTAELVEKLAGVLDAVGVAPGDRVAVQSGKSPESIALYLAVLQVGAIFLPLNPAYTGGEIDYFIGDAAPRLFVCDPAALAGHAHREGPELAILTLGTSGGGSLMERAASVAPRQGAHEADLDEPAAILYTSGTTGRSKGAILTHRNLASNCEALLSEWRFTAEDRLIHALPIFHTHGLFVAANMVLCAGATMLFETKFDPEVALDLMPEATVLMGVPTFYTRLLKSPRLTREATAGMRLFVSGSAPLLAEDHRAFEERTGHAILERYGMTETCMIASNPYEGARIPGAVGMALPGVALRVTDRATGEALPDGEIGAVEVKGPNVFKGYWNMPEKTAQEFRADGFFITGDLGQIGPDGYLRIVGRDKDLVISGGFNVYPKEVEEAIDALPGVLESAVIGVPHADFGEGVTAIVVPRPGETLDAEVLRSALEGQLARYKQPKRVVVVDELPRNVMGKVQKAELRRTYADLYAEAKVG
ncbi:malonate--CoA ligase [Salipiger mangrovisoli]|uniref:Malonyl-CoA synthase n=1 Tax=Salipiger mangrovisoli TaxID=2865933 RepID=A0ABR9X7P3_9RHOB|nr:malonyl-CoA synthase [Salipiger mangrovisoli]MBE9639591.1 malonyl-CoA synthase [Salipiger mangrovisoli]